MGLPSLCRMGAWTRAERGERWMTRPEAESVVTVSLVLAGGWWVVWGGGKEGSTPTFQSRPLLFPAISLLLASYRQVATRVQRRGTVRDPLSTPFAGRSCCGWEELLKDCETGRRIEGVGVSDWGLGAGYLVGCIDRVYCRGQARVGRR